MSVATHNPTTARRQGGIWDYVSASRLGLWAKCPLAFKFRYVDGIKTPTTAALFLGHRVHCGLEYFYRNRQLGTDVSAADVAEQMHVTWDRSVADDTMKFESRQQELALQRQATTLVATYLDQVPPAEPRPLAVEAFMEVPLVDPLTGEDLGIPLVGIVDLVLDGEAGPTIIDFKTAARGGQLLEISHELQLSCYAYCYRRLTGHVEGELQIRRLIKNKTPRIETHRYPARSEPHFRRLFALLRAYLDDLNSRRFAYRPSFACSLCDFREPHCRQWCG